MSDLRMATINGADTSVARSRVDRFAGRMHGQLLYPSDAGYDPARKVWNGMVDKRPALIARCTGADDVIACVDFARENELLVSVRGGGHNYAGKSVCDGGLMIDLSPMREISVDPVRRTARAEAGVRLGEFDRATQEFGLATTLGVNTDTGIAGLTLGGGYGWLMGKHGLACDNLISVEVVTADGRLVTASATENEDLFWALRGAGANFGVVTSFEYQLHPVGPVLGGMVLYPMSNEAIRFFDEFSSTCPDEVTTVGLLLAAPDGTPAVAIAACHCGQLDQGERLLEPLRTWSSPLADLIAPRPYVEMQKLFDEAWPPGRLYYHRAHTIKKLTAPAADVLVAYGRSLPTPQSSIYFMRFHGAASRGGTETAFPHRYDHFMGGPHPATDDPADSERMIRWGRECWGALQPFVEGAIYVNALEDAHEEGEQRVREAYGANYDRLVGLKHKYDPTNFFRLNANIEPDAVVT